MGSGAAGISTASGTSWAALACVQTAIVTAVNALNRSPTRDEFNIFNAEYIQTKADLEFVSHARVY